MNKINWTVVIVVAIIALFAFQILAGLFGGWGMMGGWRMMGPGMTLAPGASAGVGGWGFVPFGWMGMLFMWLVPVGIVVLAVLGLSWLVRNTGSGTNAPANTCSSCGYGVQASWHNCPNCGASLSK